LQVAGGVTTAIAQDAVFLCTADTKITRQKNALNLTVRYGMENGGKRMSKITFGCSGTCGDTLVNVLKLYRLSHRVPISVLHYTIHENWHGKIAEIYSLLPNVTVGFIPHRDSRHKRIHSDFDHSDKMDVEPFPDFTLPDYPMPKNYNVIAPKSGKSNEGRELHPSEVEDMIDDLENPVIIGSPDSTNYCGDYVDLRGHTSIKEAFSVIRRARSYTGMQGVMGIFALSQGIPTSMFCKTQETYDAIHRRMLLLEWKDYIKEISVL